jgi:hypothetical protein
MTPRMSCLLTIGSFAFVLGAAVPALAQQSCGDDLQKLGQQREAALQSINALVASAHGKQLDPAIFCAKSGPLNVAESAMLAYMQKNKDWCSIPDSVIDQLKTTHAKSVGFSAKACGVAAQMRKMKEQAAQGGGGGPQVQPLPSGPL